MSCDAVKTNLSKPAGDNSGASHYCIATPVGFSIGVPMKKIPLTQGKHAIVDDEDYDKLLEHEWCASKGCNTFYATRIVRVGRSRKTILMHREILNTPIGLHTDHVNGNGLDNTQNNLRVCTRAENTRNQTVRSNNTSGYKGVSWNSRKNKWNANIYAEDKNIHLGFFFCLIKAAKAYNDAAKKYYGEYAKLNVLSFIKEY